ncbi:MAG TPA: terminase [Xanthobacteraceae bacterium]|nr:terminase [Xanthobacteraceae bacterium]
MAEAARRSSQQSDPTVIWDAQPRQAAFIACPADDVGFGGARGGGKSDAVVGDWVSHEDYYGKDAIGLAFRRERTQLIELIERSKQVLKPLGYNFHEQEKYFRGPKGGRLRFAYLESDSDADAYQGHSYTRLYPEEMGTFPSEAPINKMVATLRSGNGVPCQMKGTCNPGGPGHQWVKARYALQGLVREITTQEFIFENPFTKKKITKTRVFIPSKVTDNRFLGDDYVANLFQVGSESLVRAWLDGDWDVVEGAFFDCWAAAKHVIKPFEVPAHWLRFGSFDWGSAKPYSYGLWAVSDGDLLPDGRRYPRGALIRIRENYGASSPNVGLKLTCEQVAANILETERSAGKVAYRVADPAIFAQDGGPSLAERFLRAGVPFRRADNRRVPAHGAMGGWDQVRARLVGEDGYPQLYAFDTCKDLIRTLPALQHDPDRPEDVDTDGEDHAADECRYACMSRPYVRTAPELVKPRWPIERTINELIAANKKRRLEMNE